MKHPLKEERLDGLWRIGDDYFFITHIIDPNDDQGEGPGMFDFAVYKITGEGTTENIGVLDIFTNDIGTYRLVDDEIVMFPVANLNDAREVDEPDLNDWGLDIDEV